jgi:hypothetical protein
MTIGAYPSGLPLPRVDGYRLEPGDGVIRTEVQNDEGPIAMRKRFTQRMTVVDVSFVVTRAEFAEFEQFWITTAARGASWFRISLSDYTGLVERVARFVEPWEAVLTGGKAWTIAGQLEVHPVGTVIVDSPSPLTPDALTLALSADATSGSVAAGTTGITSASITSSTAGGVGPYSYLWNKRSGNTFGLSNPTTATSQVFSSSAQLTGIVLTAVYRLTVTDSRGVTAYDEITITHTYTSADAILMEDSGYVLREDSTKILLE